MVSIRFYDDGWINKTAFFHYFIIFSSSSLPWLPEWAGLTDALPALCHQLQHDFKRVLVVVKDDHVLTGVC